MVSFNSWSTLLKGFTLFYWAFATWGLPLLIILGFWRHLYKRLPLQYDPSYWRLVFPLGVYTTAAFQFAKAADLSFMLIIPYFMIAAAFAAWLLTFFGLCLKLVPVRTSSTAREIQTG